MNKYVLIVSVGPVQGFIASARRSRDLWCGSWLLSEIAKAVANYLWKQEGVSMVFPFAEDLAKKLEPNSDFSVGNKIQVQVSANHIEDVRTLAQQAANKARERFEQIATEALNKLGKQNIRAAIWDSQINDYVEVQSAWAKVQNEDYAQASEEAAKWLAARKATRDFAPSATSANAKDFMLPKSSLDGARETVLPEGKMGQGMRRKLGLSESEQLDCAGIVKRLGGDTDQFTPVTRVAADSWLRMVAELEHQALTKLCQAYEALIPLDLATRVKGNQKCYDAFPYDGQFLYRSRLEAEYLKASEEEKQVLKQLKEELTPIWKRFGEPCAYYVTLLADGDRMGALLDQAKTIEDHQTITQHLSHFAGSVPDQMRQYHAQCVYAGGDDVFGFVPLDEAVDCAQGLAEAFEKELKKAADGLKIAESNTPTLSVGLAICHINTPLGMVRSLAKKAEKEAKGDAYPEAQQRNALGITLAVRSGSTNSMRIRWDDKEALQTFKDWQTAYQKDTISSRIAYDCRAIFMATDFPHCDDQELLNNIREAEFKRMLEKARTSSGKRLDKEMKSMLEARLEKLANLNHFATELITARWLAAKQQKDLGKENS